LSNQYVLVLWGRKARVILDFRGHRVESDQKDSRQTDYQQPKTLVYLSTEQHWWTISLSGLVWVKHAPPTVVFEDPLGVIGQGQAEESDAHPVPNPIRV
jgi:hypothetical protein